MTVSLDDIIFSLKTMHNFSDGSISLLEDKGFKYKEFMDILDGLSITLPKFDETFEDRRKKKSRFELMIERGDSEEITTGRYNRFVAGFKDISSEQAMVRGRMKFAVEYAIEIADLVAGVPNAEKFVDRPFTGEEKEKLRSIYRDFRTKDYIAVKIIEGRTKHDVVAPNTWVTIRGQQLGIDDALLRRVVHFARTSADVDANVSGELYMKALGQWSKSLSNLVKLLQSKAKECLKITCIGRTHGQDAQLTTLGHIYANLAEEIRQYSGPLMQKKMHTLQGKVAGAIGTDVDMKGTFPNLDVEPMYRKIVENVFGLKYTGLGFDQDGPNVGLVETLDAMVNVGMVIQKAAADTWLYASRGVLGKITDEGESGSSAMPQKTNPFLAEGCEALMVIMRNIVNPLKEMIVAYREQGDLRRSITKREIFHPIMLSIIGIERLISEVNNYQPNVVEIEHAVYKQGPKFASSVISNYLRSQGAADAYDRIKGVVMKPNVKLTEVLGCVNGMKDDGIINAEAASYVGSIMKSIIDPDRNMHMLDTGGSGDQYKIISLIEKRNQDIRARKPLLGNAVKDTYSMIRRAEITQKRLLRYAS